MASGRIEYSDAKPLISLSGDLSKGAGIISTLASHQGLISPRTTLSPFSSTLYVNRKRSRSADPISRESVSEHIEAPVNFRQGVPQSLHDIHSVNELYAMREFEEKNAAVEEWLTNSGLDMAWDHSEAVVNSSNSLYEGIQRKDIDLGHKSENMLIPHQLYYNIESGGPFTEVDLEFIRESRNWTDPPVLSSILSGAFKPCQPVSSQAAIEKFERMCRESDSVVSGEASCGTERISGASIAGSGNMTGGNILKILLSPPITDISTPDSAVKDAVVRPLQNRSKSLASSPAHNLKADPGHIQGSMNYSRKSYLPQSFPRECFLPKSYSAVDHGAVLKVKRSPSLWDDPFCGENLSTPTPEMTAIIHSGMSSSEFWRTIHESLPATLSGTPDVVTSTDLETDGARPENKPPAATLKCTQQIDDDCRSTIATESPTAGALEISEELNRSETAAIKPAHVRRQIGIARVQIEILSLHNSHRTNKPDDDDTGGSGKESDSENINEDGGAGTFDGNHTPDLNQPFDSSEDSSSRSRNNHLNPSGGNNQGENSGRGNDNRRPSRQPTTCPKAKKKLLRFACPYQVFETSQSCFRQALRNPEGGCAGIYRLK